MLTVIVALVGSGKSRTRSPFARRYSVMPSTEVTFSGLPGAAFGVEAGFAAGFGAGLPAVWVAAATLAAVRIAANRPSPLFFVKRICILQECRPRLSGRAKPERIPHPRAGRNAGEGPASKSKGRRRLVR